MSCYFMTSKYEYSHVFTKIILQKVKSKVYCVLLYIKLVHKIYSQLGTHPKGWLVGCFLFPYLGLIYFIFLLPLSQKVHKHCKYPNTDMHLGSLELLVTFDVVSSVSSWFFCILIVLGGLN